MDFIRDLWASLVAGARDRTTNPLSISFVISWCLWNYKFFLILFGEVSTWEKLDAIALMYPHRPSTYCGAALLYPLLSALVYVFIYPVVSMVPIWAYRTYQIWTANLVKRVEKARVLSQADAIELTRRHEREKTELEAQLNSLSVEVRQLQNALREAEEQVKPVDEPNSVVGTSETTEPSGKATEHPISTNEASSTDPDQDVPSLDATRIKLILNLSNRSVPARAKMIADAMSQNFSLVDADLKSLQKDRLVDTSQMPGGGLGWELTPRGRKIAVRLLKDAELRRRL